MADYVYDEFTRWPFCNCDKTIMGNHCNDCQLYQLYHGLPPTCICGIPTKFPTINGVTHILVDEVVTNMKELQQQIRSII